MYGYTAPRPRCFWLLACSAVGLPEKSMLPGAKSLHLSETGNPTCSRLGDGEFWIRRHLGWIAESPGGLLVLFACRELHCLPACLPDCLLPACFERCPTGTMLPSEWVAELSWTNWKFRSSFYCSSNLGATHSFVRSSFPRSPFPIEVRRLADGATCEAESTGCLYLLTAIMAHNETRFAMPDLTITLSATNNPGTSVSSQTSLSHLLVTGNQTDRWSTPVSDQACQDVSQLVSQSA